MQDYNPKLSDFGLVIAEGEILRGGPTEYADQKACKRVKQHICYMQNFIKCGLINKKKE